MQHPSMDRRNTALLRTDVERSTRQDSHPIVQLVRPPAPAWARFQVEIWEPGLCNWGYFGYARDERERAALLASIRAFSHRGRSVPLAAARVAGVRAPIPAARRRLIRAYRVLEGVR